MMKRTITELVEYMKTMPECEVLPAQGLPKTENGCNLPDDVRVFYTVCGGITFTVKKGWVLDIVVPEKFKPANPIIMGQEIADTYQNDISHNWYVIAYDGDLQWVTMDLNPMQFGYCYNSFWDRHASPGTSEIVAHSLTDFIESLVNTRDIDFWLAPDFKALGDAYGF